MCMLCLCSTCGWNHSVFISIAVEGYHKPMLMVSVKLLLHIRKGSLSLKNNNRATKIYYCGLTQPTIRTYLESAQTIFTVIVRFTLIVFSNLRLGIPRGRFCRGFSTNSDVAKCFDDRGEQTHIAAPDRNP